MAEKLFKGTGTAGATPFRPDGRIDWAAIEWSIEFQIKSGANFLVPCGTTGESPTLSHHEHNEVVGFTVKKAAGRIPVLAGTGSNSTAEAVMLTEAAKMAGADGALVVMPYYNKPTDEGVRRHYWALAEIGLPIVLYDIPGRCGGKPASPKLINELAHNGKIHGFKWASGDLDQLRYVIAYRPKGFSVLSGDDNLTYQVMNLGGDGVISVLSNLAPEWVVKFVNNMATKDWRDLKRAAMQHQYLLPLMEAMFIETNPIPVKTALAMVYPEIFKEVFRLPLCEMEEVNKARLKKVLQDYGLF